MIEINDVRQLDQLKIGADFKLVSGLNILITDTGMNLIFIETEHLTIKAFPLGEGMYRFKDKQINI